MSDKKSTVEIESTDQGVAHKGSEPEQKKPEKLNKSRRHALLGAATGASLVAWHKPIVTSMLLPAHAQTSAPPVTPPPVTTTSAFFGANVSAGPLAKASDSLLDLLVPIAHAGAASATPYTVSVVEVGTGGENFTISVFEDLGATQGFDVAQVIYSGQVSVSSGGSLSPSDNPCNLSDLVDIQVEIVDIGTDAAVINFTNRSQSLTIPAGDGTLPTPMCTDGTPALNFSVTGFSPNTAQMVKRPSLLDMIIPAANAGVVIQVPEERSYTINAAETAPQSGSFEITLLERVENSSAPSYSVVESTFSGTVTGPGSGTLSLMSAGCDEAPMDALSVTIQSVSETGLELDVNSREFSVSLSPGSVTIGSPMCEAIATADSYFQPGGAQMMNGARLSPGRSLLDLIIPEAHAGGAPSPSSFGISAIKMGDSSFQVEMLNPRGDLIRAGMVNIDGGTGTLIPQVDPLCESEGSAADVPARILSINEMEMVLNIDRNRGGSVTITVPSGSGMLIANCQQPE